MFTLNLTSDEIKLLNKILLEVEDEGNMNHPAISIYAKLLNSLGGKDIRTI